MSDNCNSCHGSTTVAFPEYIQDWTEWKSRLNSNDRDALLWLKRFNSKIVHGEMLRNAGLEKDIGVGKEFLEFIASQYSQHVGTTPRQRSPASSPTLGSQFAERMIDSSKAKEYDTVLRSINIQDADLLNELLAFDAMWDHTGNPSWSWAPHGGDSGRRGQRPVGIEPASPVRPELFKFVNGKWQWKEPFNEGFAIDSNTLGIKKFTVVRFPRDSRGNLIKGIRGSESRPYRLNGVEGTGYSTRFASDVNQDLNSLWASFPAGTKVFEVLYSTQLGPTVPIDVLVQEKRVSEDGSKAEWVKDSFRMDSHPEKIRAWVNKQTDKSNPDYAKILQALDSIQSDPIKSDLGTSGGTPFVVNGKRTGVIPGSKSVLRGVSPETLLKIYRDLPMESTLGARGWQLESQALFANSHRGIAINRKNCANCHGQSSETFGDIFKAAGLSPTSVIAYGNGPGYDGVLSAPWFSPQDLSLYGQQIKTEMRPEWGKFFEEFRPGLHPATLYRRTEKWKVSDQPLRNSE